MLPVGDRRLRLEKWLETSLPHRFSNRLLPIDGDVAEICGAMAGQAQLTGIALAIIDGLIAATAIRHNLAVATRNVKDFNAWGVPVVNPWQTE